jgi:predicted dinucleotide-binding enzyme
MNSYTIGVVGAGGMGSGITRRLTAAGHTVLVADSEPGTAATVAAEASAGQPGQARATSAEDAVSASIVVLALWYPGTVDFAATHRAALAGKIIIDIANPLDATYTGLTLEPSGAEELARAVPGSSVVKAFSTVPAPTLLAAEIDGAALDTFVASDDDAARHTVIDALQGSGLHDLDAGALANSGLLERLTAFGIELGRRYQLGFDFGFKYLPARAITPSS